MNSHIYKLAVSLVIVTFITGCVTAQKAIPKEHEAKLQTSEVERLIADLKFLSSEDLKGRETGTPGNRTAREYIIKRFKESGVQHASAERSFIQPFRFVTETKEEIAGANVVGVIKGRNESGGSIVISAHYDHLGVREGQIYNGTDDNASGTAALIAFADYFNKNKPVHDLIFVAFDAEEKGHSG
ncbi:MAG: M28 family peptidase, partial [Acidobacteriota bacterium]|nr:M28 family peptidase [Acidobacteriota bacterium]